MFNHMVEHSARLDRVFHSLSDPTRRDILKRVCKAPLSISEIAQPYRMSFAAVAKHVEVLSEARLLTKNRVGKEQIVKAAPESIELASEYLKKFEAIWTKRFAALENLLSEEVQDGRAPVRKRSGK
jgi:DNA-binding transcriptional ArsR family regulator